MPKSLLLLIASALVFVAGCATDSSDPTQEEGNSLKTAIVSKEEGEALNEKFSHSFCRRRPCAENADGTYTVTYTPAMGNCDPCGGQTEGCEDVEVACMLCPDW